MSTKNSLPSLPHEVLVLIALHSDLPSAISLSRVSRVFTSCCDQRIWREPAISLHANYGQRPLIEPHEPHTKGYAAWAKAEERAVEESYGRGMQEMIREVMRRSDGRKLGMVKSLKLSFGLGPTHWLLVLLDEVSPQLERLEIRSSLVSIDGEPRRDYQAWDVALIGAHIQFPSLSSIHLGPFALRFLESIPLICNMAPNLTSLYIDLTHSVNGDDRRRFPLPPSPSFQRDTQITELGIRSPSYDPEDDNTSIEYALARVIAKLLDRSPNVERLALNYDGYTDALSRVVQACERLPRLLDLQWAVLYSVLEEYAYPHHPEFNVSLPAVRRMAVDVALLSDLYYWTPRQPVLEELYINAVDGYTAPPPPLVGAESSPAQPMPRDFSKSIRNSPNLRTIYHTLPLASDRSPSILPYIDNSYVTGRISSYTHGGDELLHARMLSQYYEHSTFVSDGIAPEEYKEAPFSCLSFDELGGSSLTRVYEKRAEAVWQDATDLDGVAVPLAVIEEMRVVQGASREEWEGRGIEVGDEAWKVLERWREGMES